MKPVFGILILIWAAFAPLIAGAQQAPTAQDDRGYLQALLEDNLSGAGRQVRIFGFAGALSSRATIDELTIADDTGVWLTIKGAALSWNRAALLSGRLDIAELSAKEAIVARLPVSKSTGFSPEASGFSLPELPVSVNIAKLAIAKLTLGAPVLGREAALRVAGTAQLAAGAGTADLTVERIDQAKGSLQFTGSYSNATRDLALTLKLIEERGGIAARMIGLPGQPALDLQVDGKGTLDDFTANIGLSTDGAPRLTGRVNLAALPPLQPGAVSDARRYTVDIGGDLAPLFAPEYRPFLGSDIRLALRGTQFGDGRVEVEKLSLNSAALALEGTMALGADKWPQRFSLKGHVASNGDPVLLPLTGPKTRIRALSLTLGYDAAKGDQWQGALELADLERGALGLSSGRITANGTLTRSDPSIFGRVGGDMVLALDGMTSTDPAIATAIGGAVTGKLGFDWGPGGPLRLTNITANGPDYGLSGDVTLTRLQNPLDISAQGAVLLEARDLSRFAGLAGQTLTGAARLAIDGTAEILGGAFKARISGNANNLGVGVAQIDPLLGGQSALNLTVERDTKGFRLDSFTIATPLVEAKADGVLITGASRVVFDARIKDAAPAFAGLNGAVALNGTLTQSGPVWDAQIQATGPGAAQIAAKGSVTVAEGRLAGVDGVVTARADDLSPYRGLFNRPVAGAVDLTLTGQGDFARGTGRVDLSGNAQNLALGQAQLDQFLRGKSTFSVTARRNNAGLVMVEKLDLKSPEVLAQATGTLNGQAATLRFDGQLRDVATIAPGLSGAFSVTGTARTPGGGQDWTVTAQGHGLSGIALNVDGRVAQDASRMRLNLSGAAPLALANSYIQPRLATGLARFDLLLDGPPALSSLSGTVTTTAARLVAPNLGMVLGDIVFSAQLAAGHAQLQATAIPTSGGQLRLSGPVSLTPPYQSDLAITLTGIGVLEPALFDTTVDGQLTVKGPLIGGATIGGTLDLGTTEVLVAGTNATTTGAELNIRNINEPADVHQTRARAGLLAAPAGSGPIRAYPLDLVIRAPARVFVRGRGLDAELGGQIRLGGTTADVIPQGRFELIRGRLDILGKRLTLTEGLARLQGSFDPYVRMVAKTRADETTTVNIAIEGLASAPVISITSNPALPQDEVLSLMLFGRGLSKISALQALQLASAVSTLAGKGGSGIVDGIRKKFGLDDLEITTSNSGASGAKLGKYIGENIYTDITVGSDGKSEVNLNLTVTPSITARGKVTSNGETSLGIFLEKDY